MSRHNKAFQQAPQTPPYDTDAEEALLGAMLLSRDVTIEAAKLLPAMSHAWFYNYMHQRLFDLLVELLENGEWDLIIVSDCLRGRGLFECMGGHEWLVRLAESGPDTPNVEVLAGIIAHKARLRQIIQCAAELADFAYSGSTSTVVASLYGMLQAACEKLNDDDPNI